MSRNALARRKRPPVNEAPRPGFPMLVVVVPTATRDRWFEDTWSALLQTGGLNTLVIKDPYDLPDISPGQSWLRCGRDDAVTLYRQM